MHRRENSDAINSQSIVDHLEAHEHHDVISKAL